MGRKPGRVGDILKSSFGKLGVNKRLNEYMVSKVWGDAVGQDIASRARPGRLIKGKLYVTVSTSPWMTELMHLKERLKGEINRRLGHDTVIDIAFRLGEVKAERFEEKISAVERDLSPEEREVIEKTVSSMEDRELKGAIARAMKKQKGWDDAAEGSSLSRDHSR